MKKGNIQYIILGVIFALGIFTCTALLAEGSKEEKAASETKVHKTTSGTAEIVNLNSTELSFHENELAVVSIIVEKSGLMAMYIPQEDVTYNFTVGAGVPVYTQYGTIMTLGQVQVGDVVRIDYDESSRGIKEIRYTDELTVINGASNIQVNQSKHEITLYNRTYKYNDRLIVASGDKTVSPTELDSKDELTVYIDDGNIVSIKVEKGHGYIKLTGYKMFEGGYVSIGSNVVKQIVEDMLILVNEGKYSVTVSKDEYIASKTVEVKRDEMSVVDFSEFVEDAKEEGNVLFNINIDDAKLYLNGEQYDYSQGIISVPVGRYKLEVKADGYQNYLDFIDIKSDYQKYDIKMTLGENESSSSENEESQSSVEYSETSNTSNTSSSNVSSSETETVVSEKNKVYVDEPIGAAVYFDGELKGTAPVEFPMVTGSHVVTILRGAKIKSFAVNLAEGGDDVRYSFSFDDEE